MSPPAVAPIIAEHPEKTLPIAVPQLGIDSPGIIDERTWRAAILASVIIVFCVIACFLAMDWMCCAG